MSLKESSSMDSRLLKDKLSSRSLGQPLKVCASSRVIRLFLKKLKNLEEKDFGSNDISSVLNPWNLNQRNPGNMSNKFDLVQF